MGSDFVIYECLCGFSSLAEGPSQAFERVQAHCSLGPSAYLCAMSLGSRSRLLRGATEDEQPIDLLQSREVYLAQRAGLLQPSESPSRPASAGSG